MSPKRIAIIGADPIGLEAALYGARLGHDVHVYDGFRLVDHFCLEILPAKEKRRGRC